MSLLKKNIKVRKEDIWPIVSIICSVSYYTLTNTMIYMSIFKIFLVVSLISFFLYFIQILALDQLKILKKSFFFLVILITSTCVSMIMYGDTRILFIAISVFIGIYLDEQTILTTLFWTKFFWMIIILFTGGYVHINLLALNVGTLILMYICCIKERINNFKILILSIIYWCFLIYTNSGAFLIGVGITIIMLIAKNKSKRFRKILLSKLIIYIYPICLFINWYLSYGFYRSEMPFIGWLLPQSINDLYFKFLYLLNDMVSGRISLANLSLKYFGISIWGGNINYSGYDIGGQYFNLDSGMIWLLQGFGIVITIVIMYLLVFMMRFLVERKAYNYIISGIVIALWAMNEEMLMYISTNFMFFLIGTSLKRFKKKGSLYEYS